MILGNGDGIGYSAGGNNGQNGNNGLTYSNGVASGNRMGRGPLNGNTVPLNGNGGSRTNGNGFKNGESNH